MLEKLQKDYPWLFSKQGKRVVNGKRQYFTIELNPIITDNGSFWTVTREKDSSPLILSKEY